MLSRTSHDQRSHVELITVYEICRILCASLDIDRTFRAALNVLSAQMDLPRAMIVLNDTDEARCACTARWACRASRRQRGQWQPGEGVIGHVRLGHAGGGARRGAGPEFIDRTGAFSAQDGT
jgi:Nif-specific regulatory protein